MKFITDQYVTLDVSNFIKFACFQSLPVSVKRRIKALKKLQLQYTDLEADFYKEVHALEVSQGWSCPVTCSHHQVETFVPCSYTNHPLRVERLM